MPSSDVRDGLWREVDQHGAVLDVLMQSRRDKHAAKRLMRKLVKKHGTRPARARHRQAQELRGANKALGINVEHPAQGLEQPGRKLAPTHARARKGDAQLRRFKSARHLQRFASKHDQVATLFMHCRYNAIAQAKRDARTQAFGAWERVSCAPMMAGLSA